jgi:hypothetical protein
MKTHYKLYSAMAMFGMVLSAHAATPAKPKVVFIGDYVTANWTSGFAANPNWINLGQNGVSFAGQQGPPDIAPAIALHPAIIHILTGTNWSISTPPHGVTDAIAGYASVLDTMVKQAQAANTKVILGLAPEAGAIGFEGFGPYDFNTITAAYGAAHNIEVVNYADALCECINSISPQTPPASLEQYSVIQSLTNPNFPDNQGLLPTAAGYALMTTLAETAIANEYLTLETGWLSNVATAQSGLINAPDPSGQVNVCGQTCVIQFTPIGYYSDGSTHRQTNTTWNGNNGTWTSSNPLVVSVNQQGLANALTPGTATIKYTPANGVKFSSWVMTVPNWGN